MLLVYDFLHLPLMLLTSPVMCRLEIAMKKTMNLAAIDLDPAVYLVRLVWWHRVVLSLVQADALDSEVASEQCYERVVHCDLTS